MSSLAELTLSTPHDEVKSAQALALIADDLRQASQLLDELLQLARADAGEHMQRRERLFVDDILMDAVAAWRPAAARADLVLDVGEIEEAPVRVDPLLARRLLDTLIENAVRYTPPAGRIEASVQREGDRAVLTISDSGIGISADELPRIFERFFRGAASRCMVPEGSGLGLPIAAWIVGQCSGTIEIINRPAGGVAARVSLPMEQA
jgi:signal transduction histidine kinase